MNLKRNCSVVKKRFTHIISLATASLLALSTLSCTSGTTITNGDIQLTVDNKMRFSVQSLNPTTQSFYNGFIESDALYADEFTASQFDLKSVTNTEGGGSKTYTLTGQFQQGNYRLTKEQVIGASADRPGMLTIETIYINDGDRLVGVRGWKSNEMRVLVSDTSVWSFQPSSTSRRLDWALEIKPGFFKQNYLGMQNSDYGGGIPMTNIWRRDGGVAIGITEPVLKMISMPVEWKEGDDFGRIALTYDYEDRFMLAPGDTLRIFDSFISVHKGDFFDPLHQFSRFMEYERGIPFPASNPEAFEPVWCGWGYGRGFTIQQIMANLPKVAELGFKWVDIDDGFQIAEGDWEPNSRFPGGDRDMRRMTDAARALGMRSKLWWAPLAADPGTQVLAKNPGIQLVTRPSTGGGPQWITYWNSYYLSPVNPITEQYTKDLLNMFIERWGFDGLKLDGQHMNLCLPDYNRASQLSHPDEAVERMPEYFKLVLEETRSYVPDAVVQFCPCGCAINFFMIPYMNQAVSSDPTSSYQIRQKRKVYSAINDDLAYYADHVELSDGGDDFGTQIGIGAVLGSKFIYPNDIPGRNGGSSGNFLTPEKEVLFKKWMPIYKEKMLSTGSYVNLYDTGYDKPEAHTLLKDGKLYYAFYVKGADRRQNYIATWDGGPIELRGLEQGVQYTVCEYTTDEKRTFTIDGSNPVISPTFSRNYLIEVSRSDGGAITNPTRTYTAVQSSRPAAQQSAGQRSADQRPAAQSDGDQPHPGQEGGI